MWQEAKWAEMRWALPTSSISSWVSHLPPASQQSRLVWAWAHICSWIPYGTGPLSQPRGQVTDDINSYFCLSPAVSILQHEWEAWPQFLICPRLVSPQGCHACHSPPPGISVTLLLSWRGEKAERGKDLSPKVLEQAQVLPPEVSRSTATFIYFGPCSKILVASCLE